jgi:putative endonuclease
MSNNIHVGKLGEDIATRFLMKHGYQVIGRNYRKKCGEIDIIATKAGQYHFVEVKSLLLQGNVTHETYAPQENMHFQKRRRLARVIEVYVHEHGLENFRVTCHLITVLVNQYQKEARIQFIKDILL